MNIKNILKMIVLLFIGGTIYFGIEILWRGHSHISMFVLGGVFFVIVGAINEYLPWSMGIAQQSLIEACMVTFMEFATGLIVNVCLDLNVWDCTGLPFNVMGQVCLYFSCAWVALSATAIIVDDYLRYWLFNEEKPHYTLI